MFGPSKFAPRVHAGSRRWYQWQDPGERMRVEISLDVVDEIRAAVESASADVPERGEEIGGLLLGRRNDPVIVKAFEPLDCEHRRGPSFTLSAKERKALRKRIEKPPAGLEVVGFYRSHTRTGLYLDQEDFSLMQEMFSDPSQVALLVKPWAGHGQIAGFFFWEDGDIYRRATHLQFPFDSAELDKVEALPPEEAAAAAVAEEEIPASIPAPPAAPPPDFGRERARSTFTPLESVSGLFSRQHVRTALLVSCGVLGVVALGVSAVDLLPAPKVAPAASSAPSGNDVALSVTKADGGFHITWNQRSQTLARAGGATLRITDGGAERIIALDNHQIRTGNITYYAATETVTIRLDPGQQRTTSDAAVGTLDPAAPQVAAGAQAVLSPRAGRSKAKPAPKPFTPTALGAPEREGAERTQLEPPPAIASVPAAALDPALIPQKPLPQRTVAHVSYEALRPNALRKVVSKIPGLGFLQKRQYREAESFQPAKPVHRVAPAIPPGVPANGMEVELKISIDEFGTVDRAEVVSRGSDNHLEDLALQSVQSWRFAPARLENESVASEMLLRFNFDPARKTQQASSHP